MGLDMYLNKRTYVGNNYRKPEQQVQIVMPQDQSEVTFPIESEIKQGRITYVIEEVAYWRKANAIHNWFVENVQDGNDDCGTYYVPKVGIEVLVNLCKQLLEKKDPKEAERILPTQEGFFFGNTDYDEWYWNQLENTINQLEPLLKEDGDFYYKSSW